MIAVGVALVTSLVLVVLGSDAWARYTGHPQSRFSSGFVMGASIASAVWAMWNAVTLTDGSWSWRVGALAETWTARELKRLNAPWRIEHHIPFVGPKRNRWFKDIDHVAVGPYGVLAIDTKWTSDKWDLDHPADDYRVRGLADRLDRHVREMLTPTVRHHAPGAPVVPVIVCWGPRIEPASSHVTTVGAVHVLAGVAAQRWFEELSDRRLTDAQIDSLYDALRTRIIEHERNEGRTPDAVAGTRRRMRFTMWMAVVAAASVVVLFATFGISRVSPRFSHGIVRVFRAVHTGGVLVFLLAPLALSALASAASLRLLRRLKAFHLHDRRAVIRLAVSIASIGGWIGTAIFISRS